MAAPDRGGWRAGFMLVEVMVAIVIAGLMLSVLGQALAGAWGAGRTPIDVLSAVTIAQAALHGPAGASGRAPSGYRVTLSAGSIGVTPRPSPLAPAPLGAATDSAAGAPGRDADHPGSADPPPPLKHIAVTVTTPNGRSLSFETLGRDAAAP